MNSASSLVNTTHTQEHIMSLVKQQQSYFSSHATLPVNFRKEKLQKLLVTIQKHEQAIIDALYKDFKKSPFESFATEIGLVISELKASLKHIDKWSKPQRVKETLFNFPATSYIYPEPYGVSLIIAPWNYPFQLVFNPVISSIAAGNCVIIKPSELTPATSAIISQIINETFDEKHVALVTGGQEVTEHLLAQRFNHIFFTGSTRVGKIVLKAASANLTPVVLELGGKSPVIVAENANLDIAARRIIWGKFINAGQTCIAPDYLLVHKSIKQEFIALLKKYIVQFYGNDISTSPDYPRIISNHHFKRLESFLKPHTIIFGGKTNEQDLYIEPTLLHNISWQDEVMQEEIFGPILPIIEYTSLDEAIDQINKNEKPLAFYFFGSDNNMINNVLTNISFGGGCINDTVSHIANSNLPFGGVGNSGMGGYHGKFSFDAFSHKKSVVYRGTWLDLPLRYAPYNNRLSLIKKIFNWL